MIAMAQLGNHMRAMHRGVEASVTPIRETRDAPPKRTSGVELVWDEPPTGRRRGLGPALTPLVEALREHPGRWARLRDYTGPTSANTQVKKARELFPDCEWRAGRHEDGSALWARAEPSGLPGGG